MVTFIVSPNVIYFGFSFLLIFYAIQAKAVIKEAKTTVLVNHQSLLAILFSSVKDPYASELHSDDRIRVWPFCAITIIFPFAISAFPFLFDFDVMALNSDVVSSGKVFVILSDFAVNFIVVLITVEFSLLYGFRRLPKHWLHLLLVAVALDILMFTLVSFSKRSIDSQIDLYVELPWSTIIFLLVGCCGSFFASLIIVVSIRNISDVGVKERNAEEVSVVLGD